MVWIDLQVLVVVVGLVEFFRFEGFISFCVFGRFVCVGGCCGFEGFRRFETFIGSGDSDRFARFCLCCGFDGFLRFSGFHWFL